MRINYFLVLLLLQLLLVDSFAFNESRVPLPNGMDANRSLFSGGLIPASFRMILLWFAILMLC